MKPVLLFFLGLLLMTPFISPLGLAEEARAFDYHFDFNQPVDFQNSSSWTQIDGELRFKGNDSKKEYPDIFMQKIIANFRMEVKAQWTGGSESGGFGVVYRYTDANNYFSFQITNEGRFRIAKTIKGAMTDLVPWKNSGVIAENFSNMLSVICIGDQLKFYINNSLVAVLVDKDLSQNLVHVGIISHGDVLCSFDDFIVQGVTSVEKNSTSERPGKKVDFSYSTQGFNLQPPWKIQFGKLLFSGGPQTDNINILFDEYTKPLIISLKTTWISKSKTDGFGIVYNFRDENSYYVYLISAQGDFRIAQKTMGTWKVLSEWKKSVGFKEKINILTVEYSDKTITFSVNGTNETSLPVSTVGNGYIRTGIFTNGSVRCSFDDFSVQELPPVPKSS